MKMKAVAAIASMAAVMMIASCADSGKGRVRIELPENYSDSTLIVSHILLDNIFTAKQQDDLKVIYDTLTVNHGIAELTIDPAGAAWYDIEPPVMTRQQPEFYAKPGEILEVVIKSFDPLDLTVKGSPLMEDMTLFYSMTQPIQHEYAAFVESNDSIGEDQVKGIMDRYDGAVKKFVAEHPDSHVVPFAIMELSGDDFKKAYDNMSAEAKKSILMPYAENYNKEVVRMQSDRADEEARRAEVASGKIKAPDFTLPDLNGKMVSLSSFKGKWVVLDFWGSWCGWCVKGFPALKEAYKKYGDKIVVIGIDCNESEDEWKAGVKEHQLPWLNLYNGHDRALYADYNIEGFPTKAIINPEGNLVDLTTGEDPEFFTRLANFVN